MIFYSLLLYVFCQFCSCTTDVTNDVVVNICDEEFICASLDDYEGRVQLNDNHKMVWTANDYIYVFGPNSCKRYKFSGNTGDRSGTFKLTNTYTPVEYDFDKYYAVCPFGKCGITTSGKFRFYSATPGIGTQVYEPNSSAIAANMVFATSDDGENFTFKNVLGFLRVSLTGEKSVKSIELTDNSGATIAGRYYFYHTEPEKLYWNSSSDLTSSILLDCGDGVKLSDKPTDFYFAMKPMALKDGVTINVTFTDGTIFPQSTTKEISIVRNTIQPMAVINTSNVTYQTVGIAYNGADVLLPTISGATSLSGYVDWGDGNISILGLVTNYSYLDELSNHCIAIKMRNANKIKFNGCYGVEEIDISQF